LNNPLCEKRTPVDTVETLAPLMMRMISQTLLRSVCSLRKRSITSGRGSTIRGKLNALREAASQISAFRLRDSRSIRRNTSSAVVASCSERAPSYPYFTGDIVGTGPGPQSSIGSRHGIYSGAADRCACARGGKSPGKRPL
jgi:hypothetical protein